MSTNIRWVGRESADAIIDTRLKCYAGSMHDRARYRVFLDTDIRTRDGDVLLLEQAGQAVGTMTSLSLTFHAHSASFPCQGVAWVGTIKTARRKRTPGQRGIASQVMLAGLDRARERGEVVSALMPFRASFYEHFGYGVVERRNLWTIPVSLIPSFDAPGLRFFDPADLPALAAARTREAQQGHCDIDTGLDGLKYWATQFDDGMVFVDTDPAGTPIGYLWMKDETVDKQRIANVLRFSAPDHAGFCRLFGALAGLRDQYSAVRISLPVDWPIHHLLGESQLPHRPVDHPTAHLEQYTRMQIRILDPIRYVEALRPMPGAPARAVLSIRESEGHETRIALDFDGSRFSAKSTDASADLTMTDVTFACLASGDLTPTFAHRIGKLDGATDKFQVLAPFTATRAPWCQDYF